MPARNVLQYQDWGWFTSQISTDGSGHNNCGQASIVAAALAADAVDRARGWQDLINACCVNTRGYPDSPSNPYTNYAQMEAGMDAWDIRYTLTYDYARALSSAWSIVLCAGTGVRYVNGQRPYPASWFNNASSWEMNHFVLWGPQLQGSSYWVMNPLDLSDSWHQYDPTTWQQSFGSAYVLSGLPTPQAPSPPQPAPPEQLAPARFRCIRPEGFGLKPEAKSGGKNVAFVDEGEEGNDTGQRVLDAADPTLRWGYLQYMDTWGWAPSNRKYFERLT